MEVEPEKVGMADAPAKQCLVRRSKRLPWWLWISIAHALGIRTKPNDRSVVATVLYASTMISALGETRIDLQLKYPLKRWTSCVQFWWFRPARTSWQKSSRHVYPIQLPTRIARRLYWWTLALKTLGYSIMPTWWMASQWCPWPSFGAFSVSTRRIWLIDCIILQSFSTWSASTPK